MLGGVPTLAGEEGKGGKGPENSKLLVEST